MARLHGYQGKEILAANGFKIPRGRAANTPDEVVAAAKELSGNNGAEVVIKIQPGKLADMILIDGDPTKEIRDIHKITTVIKGGKVYDPVAIEKSLGIAPRATPR